jgi:hypothetical protein
MSNLRRAKRSFFDKYERKRLRKQMKWGDVVFGTSYAKKKT